MTSPNPSPLTPINAGRVAGGQWTAGKAAKAWRIFNTALPVIADGVGVPADELRMFLLEGWMPPPPAAVEDDAEDEAPAAEIEPLAEPPSVDAPANDDDAILAHAPAAAKFMLRGKDGTYLHMSCEITTRDRTLAWIGKRDQLRAVRRKYPKTKQMTIARVVSIPKEPRHA